MNIGSADKPNRINFKRTPTDAYFQAISGATLTPINTPGAGSITGSIVPTA